MGLTQTDNDYAITRRSELSLDQAIERVRAELQSAGFGVLCEIDVAATLKSKLGVERDPYVILGACNPSLAHQAMEAEPELGVLLPCNVVVYEHEGATQIAAVNAERMLSIVGNERLSPIAQEVKERLSAVVERAARSSSS
jgi:uncharacterized protein (DUF302 family)